MSDRRVSRALAVLRLVALCELLALFVLGAAVQHVTQPPNPVGTWGWVFTDVATHQSPLAAELTRQLEQWRAEMGQR